MATKLIAILITLIGLSAVPTTDAHGKTETLHFATLHLEPYGFLGGEGAPRGIFQKIHATIARRAGFEFSDTVMPIKRALKAILRGTSDCGVFIRTRRNEEIYDHVAKVRDRFDSVIVTRSEFHITRVDGLNGHVLALPRGSYAGYSITESSKISRYLTNGYAQSARLLKAGRVDAIAGSAVSIFFNLHRLDMSRKDVGTILIFDRKPLWLLCTRGRLSKGEASRLRKAADSLRNKGVFEKYIRSQLVADFE